MVHEPKLEQKALQAGTSHYLGQNFAKAFDVKFQNQNKEQEYVYASSWGVSTRLIGAMVMSHSDDNGLVIPPKLASLPVVFVPIWRSDEEMELVLKNADEMTQGWDKLFFKIDDRDNIKPGRKFNEWELKGIPIRIEIGPRDCESKEVVVVRRDTGEKVTMPMEGLLPKLEALLDDIQDNLLANAKKRMVEGTHIADDFKEYKKAVKTGGFYKIHWCGENSCEDYIQERSKSTIRCIPFDAPDEEGECIVCQKPSKRRVIAAQSY